MGGCQTLIAEHGATVTPSRDSPYVSSDSNVGRAGAQVRMHRDGWRSGFDTSSTSVALGGRPVWNRKMWLWPRRELPENTSCAPSCREAGAL
jgi:hypothetical protein